MKTEKIVILLSTYNGENFINEQLKSIYNQSVNAQVLLYVRDDGSSDKTTEIIDSWTNELDIIWDTSKDNLKSALSFWRLLNTAPEGDYYAFCDQDDYWYSDKLQTAIKAIKESQTSGVLYCAQSRKVDEKGTVLTKRVKRKYYIPNFDIISQFICCGAQGCTMVMDKEMRKRLLDKKICIISNHDWICDIYAIALGKVIFEPKYCMDYRQHNNNVVASDNKNIVQKFRQKYNRIYHISRNCPNDKVAEEFLNNCKDSLNCETVQFLEHVSKYKKKFTSKIWLIFKKYKDIDKRAVFSCKLKIIFNLF